jgi:hypothetical protein
MKIVEQNDGICIMKRKENLKYRSNVDNCEVIVPSPTLTDELFIVDIIRTVVDLNLKQQCPNSLDSEFKKGEDESLNDTLDDIGLVRQS